jgi:hypothetical protein
VLDPLASRNCLLPTSKQLSDRGVRRCHLISLPGSFGSRARLHIYNFERTAVPHYIHRFGSTAFYPLIRKSGLRVGRVIQFREPSGSLATCYQCHLADARSLAGTSFYQHGYIRSPVLLGTPFYLQSSIYRRTYSTSRYG